MVGFRSSSQVNLVTFDSLMIDGVCIFVPKLTRFACIYFFNTSFVFIFTGCLWYENNICIQSVKANNLVTCTMVLTDTMAFIPNGVKNLKR